MRPASLCSIERFFFISRPPLNSVSTTSFNHLPSNQPPQLTASQPIQSKKKGEDVNGKHGHNTLAGFDAVPTPVLGGIKFGGLP